jgi:agmatine deiminase
MEETPAALGYRLPAEWEPHAATWIAWPHNRDDWPGKFGPIPWVYVEIVRHLSRREPVHILVDGRRARLEAAERLERGGVDLDRVRFFKIPTDRVWTRDTGPMFVVHDRAEEAGAPPVGLVDWRFNAWAKYDDYRRDDRVPRRLARRLGLKRWKPRADLGGRSARVVLEGGAIDGNGRGTLLTTEECLLSPVQARNPGLGREDLERVLADYLGVRHVVWLGRGIAGDDTHGHVDDLARFVDPTTVVTVVERDEADANYGPLQENLRRLRAARDQDGAPLRVVELPMPAPVAFDGQRLPASYANFFIADGLVLVPTFNDPADREALATLAGLFEGREVVGIHCVDLVWGLGTLHCMTRDQPRGPAVHGGPRCWTNRRGSLRINPWPPWSVRLGVAVPTRPIRRRRTAPMADRRPPSPPRRQALATTPPPTRRQVPSAPQPGPSPGRPPSRRPPPGGPRPPGPRPGAATGARPAPPAPGDRPTTRRSRNACRRSSPTRASAPGGPARR